MISREDQEKLFIERIYEAERIIISAAACSPDRSAIMKAIYQYARKWNLKNPEFNTKGET